MVTLFGFLLFWFGFVITIAGTIIVAALVTPHRAVGAVAVFIYFIMSGAVSMGSAGVNFSYIPSSPIAKIAATILWVAFSGSMLFVLTKPYFLQNSQEDTKPPK